ncbi:E3 ubiquitin-protein ligase FANCL [Acropora cervicornis]|uniref:E3 ubiquitin-protein ligase FANCL n=1 Tax=Acropora cervicornis TaxID=6130 RepID=A0AAD9QUT1_ACRCE|nr:E3 ubiquitin-protein ligase FANCL [Acropora cervicornis]
MAGDVDGERKLEVLDVCPQLVLQDRTKGFYDGYIIVCKFSNFSENSWGSKAEENGKCQRLLQSADLPSFLLELKNILICMQKEFLLICGLRETPDKQGEEHSKFGFKEKLLKCQKSEKVTTQPMYYTHLVAEIEAIGWESLCGSFFSSVENICQHPHVAPTCATDLPVKQFTFSWSPQGNPLQHLCYQFEQVLCQFQDFWDMLDEIDHKTWILEPDQPRRSCTNRRIALGNNASIQIDLNPANPRLLPECRFLGPDNVVVPLREHLNAGVQSWDPQLSVFVNLECLLGQKFPSPSTTKKEDFSMECGICYAYCLNDLIPDKVCEDSRCGQSFHSLCLYEWLRDLPSTRQSFNMVFGDCPYCSKPIIVKMVSGK